VDERGKKERGRRAHFGFTSGHLRREKKTGVPRLDDASGKRRNWTFEPILYRKAGQAGRVEEEERGKGREFRWIVVAHRKEEKSGAAKADVKKGGGVGFLQHTEAREEEKRRIFPPIPLSFHEREKSRVRCPLNSQWEGEKRKNNDISIHIDMILLKRKEKTRNAD